MPDIGEILERMSACQGEPITMRSGLILTYTIEGNDVLVNRDGREHKIPVGQFTKALKLVPAENTTSFHYLWGSTYIYAILDDPRIRLNDW